MNIDDLDVYLVGGAVRDGLLGRPMGDRDWVVVGSSVEQMLSLGFTQVGRDFPVFLHPDSHEEYALARTERKTGPGHTGFVVHADASVTLEADLARRDLTINAIAQRGDTLVDPFNGQADLDAKMLRHVSPAFVEDPLRVFRVARFNAQLPAFRVAPETQVLMQQMCERGDLADLSAERVWQELEKALGAVAPEKFFAVLDAAGGLTPWLSELTHRDISLPQGDALCRYAHLPLDQDDARTFAERLKVPNRYREILSDKLTAAEHLAAWQELPVAELAEVFTHLKVQHSDVRLDNLLAAVSIEEEAGLRQLARAFQSVRLEEKIPPGPEYGAALHAARVQALADAKSGASQGG